MLFSLFAFPRLLVVDKTMIFEKSGRFDSREQFEFRPIGDRFYNRRMIDAHAPSKLRIPMFRALTAAVVLIACISARGEPLTVGESFILSSKVLAEPRRINVYRPVTSNDEPLPVLYMPDGGIGEDFLHVAGLVQVGVGNGTMRPFILVGIENTERRRDMTGPTQSDADKKIAPRVGGSAKFRVFIRDELMPHIRTNYRTTAETAIVGESLAGLFVIETLLLEPALFDTYIAFDPSLWWNDSRLVNDAKGKLTLERTKAATLYFASSSEPDMVKEATRFAEILKSNVDGKLRWHYEPMPQETHATIYHPAALKAFREVFKPASR